MKILVINAGSSSIKYQLYEMPHATVIAKGNLERIGEETAHLAHQFHDQTHTLEAPIDTHEQGISLILETLVDEHVGVINRIDEIEAVGHRVVHGGDLATGSTVIDQDVIDAIETFAELAPLHNPPNLAGIQAARAELPQAIQVACFDTAFHTTIPPVAYTYPLPHELYDQYRVRRYGFHGTSHRYVARRAAKLLGRDKYDVNLITCHLGNGCSITAVKKGHSVDTSMGLTPLEGLVMGTRSGDVDPAILFFLARKGYTVEDLKIMCNKQSGLLGVSGISKDMRDLIQHARAGNDQAQLAIDIFCYRLKKYIGAYTAVLGTLDAVVFTGGIGENAPDIRAAACSNLQQLGLEIDAQRNADTTRRQEAVISTDTSPAQILVVPTNEEEAIARDTYKLVQQNLTTQMS